MALENPNGSSTLSPSSLDLGSINSYPTSPEAVPYRGMILWQLHSFSYIQRTVTANQLLYFCCSIKSFPILSILVESKIKGYTWLHTHYGRTGVYVAHVGLSSALQPNPKYPQISMGKPSKIFSMTTVLFFHLQQPLNLRRKLHTLFRSSAKHYIRHVAQIKKLRRAKL